MIPRKDLQQLFEQIIEKRGVHETLKMTSQQVRDLRRYHQQGKVSEGRMLEILNKAGLLELRIVKD